MEGFQIGNVRIPGKLVLGPMAGVTDLPFRLLCKEQGADLVYTEMISAKGIFYKNKNTELLWMTKEQERPLALQLFGSEPALMADMAAQIEERSFDILDINMGCPVPKVVSNGEGSALMKDPQLAGEIVKAVSSRISKPVTVNSARASGLTTAMPWSLRNAWRTAVRRRSPNMAERESSIMAERRTGTLSVR